jgi:streptogramin lyase
VAVAAADVAVFVAAHDGAPAAAADADPNGNHVAVIDPRTNSVVDRVAVGPTPTTVVAGYGGAWVLNQGDETLSRIDSKTRRVVETIPLEVTAHDLALGAGGVWFAGRIFRDVTHPPDYVRLERINPVTGHVDRRFVTHTGANVIAAGGNAVWSTGILPGRVRGSARSDAKTGAMQIVDIKTYGDLIVADNKAAYWVGSIASRVARVSTRTSRLTRVMLLATNAQLAGGYVPPNSTDVALGAGALWISAIDGSVRRVDLSLRAIQASIHVCRNAIAIAYGEGAVWVACGDETVVRVDPKTHEVGRPIPVGGLPRGIAAGSGAVWVTLN